MKCKYCRDEIKIFYQNAFHVCYSYLPPYGLRYILHHNFFENEVTEVYQFFDKSGKVIRTDEFIYKDGKLIVHNVIRD